MRAYAMGSGRDSRSGCHEFEGGEVQVGGTLGQVEHFDADDLVGLIVIEDDAGRDFFGFDDGRVVETQVEGVGFFVDVEFHVVRVAARPRITPNYPAAI